MMLDDHFAGNASKADLNVDRPNRIGTANSAKATTSKKKRGWRAPLKTFGQHINYKLTNKQHSHVNLSTELLSHSHGLLAGSRDTGRTPSKVKINQRGGTEQTNKIQSISCERGYTSTNFRPLSENSLFHILQWQIHARDELVYHYSMSSGATG